SVEDKITRARRAQNPGDAAFLLREALDEIRSTVRKDYGPPKSDQAPKGDQMRADRPKSLWDRLGGETMLRAVAKEFVKIAGTDPKVDFTRKGKYKFDEKANALLEQRLVEFFSEITGGPLRYAGKDMKTAHAGMGITEEEFKAASIDLVKA